MAETKTTFWILGNQLLANHPLLEGVDKTAVTILFIESAARVQKLPYQRKKLVLLFSAMRHYAQELQAQGFQVDYRAAPTFLAGLRAHVAAYQPDELLTMAAADWSGRAFQQGLAAQLGLPVTITPDRQFLVAQFNPYPDTPPEKPIVMEYFYREMRRHFNVLMDDRQPVSGQWNYDKENRKPLPAGLPLPAVPVFAPDAITQAVMAEAAALPGIGAPHGFSLAVTRAQAQAACADFFAHRLADFGAYEDAMTVRHATLFHSLLSPYLNIGLLEPLELIRAAEQAYHDGRAPLNSVEGFVRQILGWREYIYWQYWRQGPALLALNEWGAERPLPPFFWSGATEMNCLRHVIHRALEDGYTHHIERLMVVGNFAMLAGLKPTAVNDWFLACYLDAYEWVMAPNVLGMALNADGGRTATKPYIASANYIHKMSNYCAGCRFSHKQRHGDDACPFNFLYWNFLIRHEAKLRANSRLGQNVLGLRHLDEAERTAVTRRAQQFFAAFDSEAVG
ncbi:MAG: cryptochrome/photolyase family protein [Chloroflexi bacterium]|nr:cryptochrome/photolyase family protein [Chloroflexota bacterium]